MCETYGECCVPPQNVPRLRFMRFEAVTPDRCFWLKGPQKERRLLHRRLRPDPFEF